MSRRLPNYVRRLRKRAGLSQNELAYLLGARGEAKVSRYERFARRPSLNTAFGCEAVFGVAASEIFAGMYGEVNRQVHRRAKRLLKRLSSKEAGSVERKVEFLQTLLGRTDK